LANFSLRMRIPAGIFLLFLLSCQSPSTPPLPAFYYWQTTFRLSPPERAYLDSLNCRRLYVKFLDIGRPPGGEIQPYALLEMQDTAGRAGKTVIPCVFLTNSVFQNIKPEEIDWLAQKTVQALGSVARQFPGIPAPDVKSSPLVGGPGGAVQFDCDWTAPTRAAYFAYLQAVRQKLPPGTTLEATIRLHQYKFPGRTGVPPVDRGMLMFYNTGDIESPEEENSIFTPAVARKYVVGAPSKYPLPLDIALPAFAWTLVYRDGEFWKILPEIPPSELSDTLYFTPVNGQPPSAGHPKEVTPGSNVKPPPLMGGSGGAVVSRGTFRQGHYLRPGDLLRTERIDPALLEEAARLAAPVRRAGDAAVAFYHLDTATVQRYPARQLQAVWDIFEQN
jgi:hypothetical protein